MRIEDGPKLDFSDVLIRPKRSTLGSRAEVDVNRTFRSLHPALRIHEGPSTNGILFGRVRYRRR